MKRTLFLASLPPLLALSAPAALAQIRPTVPGGVRMDANRSITDLLQNVVSADNNAGLDFRRLVEGFVIWEDEDNTRPPSRPTDPEAISQWIQDVASGKLPHNNTSLMTEDEWNQYLQARGASLEQRDTQQTVDNLVGPLQDTIDVIYANPDSVMGRSSYSWSPTDNLVNGTYTPEVVQMTLGQYKNSLQNTSQAAPGQTSMNDGGDPLSAASNDYTSATSSVLNADSNTGGGGGGNSGGDGSGSGDGIPAALCGE